MQSDEESWEDAKETQSQAGDSPGRADSPGMSADEAFDLLEMDMDRLLEAMSMPASEWPEPSTLASAWRFDGSSVPHLSLPDDVDASDSPDRDYSDLEDDPERTPRPPQKESMRPLSYVTSKTPPSLWIGKFPSPPPRSLGKQRDVSDACRKLNESVMLGSETDEEDEDLFSDRSAPSPSHSRSGSYESNTFRWSSSTSSTMLSMPSRSLCDDIAEEEGDECGEEAARLQAYLAQQSGRRRSSDTMRPISAQFPRVPRPMAPPLVRSHTEPLRSSKEPEWNTLIDALFGIEPRPAPRPPVWRERDLPPIPSLHEKQQLKLKKKASAASIASAMSVNGAFPLLSKRTTSLKKSRSGSSSASSSPRSSSGVSSRWSP